MRKIFIILLIFLNIKIIVLGETIVESIPEEVPFKIQCQYTKVEKKIEKIFSILPEKGVYHYKIYLPKGYHQNKNRKYPILFISMPGGNAKMKNVKNYVDENEWIVCMLVESKNKTKQSIMMGNFLAAHDDVVKKFRIQEGLKFATGFSGGARCASYNAGMRTGFGGFILQGAGFGYNFSARTGSVYYSATNNPDMAVYMIMGKKDKNNIENERTTKVMSPLPNPFIIDSFNGEHSAAPAKNMESGLAWLEEQVFSRIKDKDVFKYYFNKQSSELLTADLENDFKAFIKLDALKARAQNFRLHYDKDHKDTYKKLIDLHKGSKNSAPIKKELSNQKKFNLIELKENKLRESLSKKKVSEKVKNSKITDLKKSYQAFIKRYPNSFFTSKAQDKVKNLDML